MSLRPLVLWPDPRLSTVCAPVGEITGEVEALAVDLLETMYAAEGRGLAAPQVGVLQRVFVTDVGWKEGARVPRVFINPVLEEAGAAELTQDEGCLSIPGVTVPVRRPEAVRFSWTALDGSAQRERFEGFAAVCMQHEMDHLEGVVTFDRLDAAARADLIAAYAAQ
ncbi:MAG: peptide deformylase [Pseudomonadota bacterium]